MSKYLKSRDIPRQKVDKKDLWKIEAYDKSRGKIEAYDKFTDFQKGLVNVYTDYRGNIKTYGIQMRIGEDVIYMMKEEELVIMIARELVGKLREVRGAR